MYLIIILESGHLIILEFLRGKNIYWIKTRSPVFRIYLIELDPDSKNSNLRSILKHGSNILDPVDLLITCSKQDMDPGSDLEKSESGST